MRIAPFVLLAACGDDPTFFVGDTNDTAETGVEETDVDETDTVDTADTGTDEDGDGWTVEEGDCDDTTIWANPAWPERPDDQRDNDCDGVVDEEFAGLTFVDSGAGTALVDLNLLGEVERTVAVSPSLTPGGTPAGVQLGQRITGEGWAFTDRSGVVGELDAKGVATALWDDSETVYADGEEPLGYFGLGVHPDGWYAVSGGDRLWRVDADGKSTVLAQWDCLEGVEGTTDICPVDVAVDRFSGEVVLFGYFGGYAVWTEGTGLDVVVPDNIDPYAPKYQFWSTQIVDDGTRLAMGSDPEGNQGIYAWDAEAEAYEVHYLWPSAVIADAFSPVDFAIDQISRDVFATMNRDWFPYVWRISPDVGQADVLYPAVYGPLDPDYVPPAYDHAVQSIMIRYSAAP